MIINPQVPLHRLILSLSEALDYVHPLVADHQQRTAYIAIAIARRMGITGPELYDLFQAAALHDIGLIGHENRIRAVHLRQLEGVSWHGELGYELLKDNPLFARAAEIIRHHHVRWANGQGTDNLGVGVPIASHILVLADHVERAIDRDTSVLQQAPRIISETAARAGIEFHSDCVDAFCEVAAAEAFWLDAASPRIYALLLHQADWPVLTIDEVAIRPIAEVFARVVDAASPWTAVHSAGVTATAVALSERLNFSPREQHLMRAAGYLHDLGKLAVPSKILDKPGRLTPEEYAIVKSHTYYTFRILDTIGGMPQICEWAAFHHERLDGKGYPFRHAGRELTLGSRIMAVADVFTALTEDRPYRDGLSSEAALAMLTRMADAGALDADVIAALHRDHDDINALRRQEQAAYGDGQDRLTNVMQTWSHRADGALLLA
ncbi:MAG: HD domain-containing protein [Phycisphaerae bacterium]|jgi:HD-GYP domain-containing protein (c-di-GMP phosphodiesterase class II)